MWPPFLVVCRRRHRRLQLQIPIYTVLVFTSLGRHAFPPKAHAIVWVSLCERSKPHNNIPNAEET